MDECVNSDPGAGVPIDTMNRDLFSPEDAEIVREIVSGNINAFEKLLDRYQDLVLRIVKKHIPQEHVEDAAQEVFINLFHSLPTFLGESALDHWISTVAVRTCYKFWRNRSHSREQPVSSLPEKHRLWLEEALSDPAEPSLTERVLQKEAAEILDWALNRLSAEDRMVLELVYLEGCSVKEAARLLGWSVVNVKVRSFRARQKLQKDLCRPLRESRRRT
jgi:RNA polymerase sigma-70 factor, ECF subfamily